MLTAARLAAAGHTVYATLRNFEKRNDLLEEVKRLGGEVQLCQLDVTDELSIRTTIQKIVTEAGRLHILINNAGYGIGGFFEDLTEEEVRAQFETNFFGVQKVTRAALPLLRSTASRSDNSWSVQIINISSVQGRSALPGMSAYAASKFALEGFSESLVHELRPLGIHVVIVEPGAYQTRIFSENARLAERAFDPQSPYIAFSVRMWERANRVTRSSKFAGDPEKVARLLEKIINQPQPRPRYLIGRLAQLRLLLQKMLPWKLYSNLVQKIAFGDGPINALNNLDEGNPHT